MTLAELRTALKGVCPKVAYRQFVKAVKPPYICYLVTGSDDVLADDENYRGILSVDIELYTEGKDLALESDLEDALRALGLVWTMVEVNIDEEGLLEVVYSTQMLPESSDDSS
jgi:hypothetical protein